MTTLEIKWSKRPSGIESARASIAGNVMPYRATLWRASQSTELWAWTVAESAHDFATHSGTAWSKKEARAGAVNALRALAARPLAPAVDPLERPR
jgi:hypothetical protein